MPLYAICTTILVIVENVTVVKKKKKIADSLDQRRAGNICICISSDSKCLIQIKVCQKSTTGRKFKLRGKKDEEIRKEAQKRGATNQKKVLIDSKEKFLKPRQKFRNKESINQRTLKLIFYKFLKLLSYGKKQYILISNKERHSKVVRC